MKNKMEGQHLDQVLSRVKTGIEERDLSQDNPILVLLKQQSEQIMNLENEMMALREEIKVCNEGLSRLPTKDDVSNLYCTRLWFLGKLRDLWLKLAHAKPIEGVETKAVKI